MRTTVDLAEDVYDHVRRQSFEQRRSMGAVLSELARAGMRGPGARAVRPIGLYDGQGRIADDFDELPDDIAVALDRPIA
jgi:hypothetical protein